MKAEIIAIGTELIIGHTLNTNATYISEFLNGIGISVHYHTTLGDNEARIIDALEHACKRSDLVICTGGLGPTDDDITHDTLAKFLDRKLEQDPHQVEIFEEKYAAYAGHYKTPKINYKQTRVLDGAEVVPNPIGTAIGMYLEHNATCIVTFPGVPCEMEAMLKSIEAKLLEKLKSQNQIGAIISKKVRLTDITESLMAETVIQHYQDHHKANPFLAANPSLAPYATLGECYLRITAKGETQEEAQDLVDKTSKNLHEIFPDKIYGYDDDTLAGVLAQKLIDQNLTIAFAESCTGGLASKMLTDVSGASNYTKLNLVTYSNEAKIKMLGIEGETLNKYGAVSLECAKEMALGLCKISDSAINVSITGIAGPGGASLEKPIGTIFVAVVINGEIKFAEKLNWVARQLSRDQVRELTCKKVFWIVVKLIDQLS